MMDSCAINSAVTVNLDWMTHSVGKQADIATAPYSLNGDGGYGRARELGQQVQLELSTDSRLHYPSIRM